MLDQTKAYFISTCTHPYDGKFLGMCRLDMSVYPILTIELLDTTNKVWVEKPYQVNHLTCSGLMIELPIYTPTPNREIDRAMLYYSGIIGEQSSLVNTIETLATENIYEWYKYVALYEVILNTTLPVLKEMDESPEII